MLKALKLKERLRAYLFTGEYDKLERYRNQIMSDYERMQHERKRAYNDMRAEVSIIDLVREVMKGFNPRDLDSEEELLEMLEDEDSVDAFLAEAKKLTENTALPKILAYIERNQIQYSARDAKTLEEINFGRATLNGIQLLRDELASLLTAWEERHAPPEEFDPFDPIAEE